MQHRTSQHPYALQHNATIGITHIPSVVLTALGGQLGYNNFGAILDMDSNYNVTS